MMTLPSFRTVFLYVLTGFLFQLSSSCDYRTSDTSPTETAAIAEPTATFSFLLTMHDFNSKKKMPLDSFAVATSAGAVEFVPNDDSSYTVNLTDASTFFVRHIVRNLRQTISANATDLGRLNTLRLFFEKASVTTPPSVKVYGTLSTTTNVLVADNGVSIALSPDIAMPTLQHFQTTSLDFGSSTSHQHTYTIHENRTGFPVLSKFSASYSNIGDSTRLEVVLNDIILHDPTDRVDTITNPEF